MINILIVDDNRNNRLTLTLLLEEISGIDITEVENGKEAVEICKTKYFDLIFMDIMMPVMDGIEATKKIKKFSKNSMIIALSVLNDTDSKHRMMNSGAEDYITKPIDSELFLQRVNNYLDIISLKDSIVLNKDAINPFSKTIFDRVLIFKVKDKSSLVQFWNYFLRDNAFDVENLCDYIRIVYTLGLWAIKNDKKSTISIEEGKTKLFISVDIVEFISKRVITHIIKKHLPDCVFAIEGRNLCLELSKKRKQEIEEELFLDENNSKEIEVDGDTKNILTKTHINKLPAEEFLENTPISILPKLDLLEDVENRLDELMIEFENTPSKKAIEKICDELGEYSATISMLVEFEHLAFAIDSLIEILRQIDEESFHEDRAKALALMLISLLDDLSSWREVIFVRKVANDVHYLDASLLSSCLQIKSIFEDTDTEEEEELEFF